MPAKRKSSANDRRNGNDAGLIAPGKKISKQPERSITALNGLLPHANGKVHGSASIIPQQGNNIAHLRLEPALVTNEDAEGGLHNHRNLDLPTQNGSGGGGGGTRGAKGGLQDSYQPRTYGVMDKDTNAATESPSNSGHHINGFAGKDVGSNSFVTGEPIATVIGAYCSLDMLAMLFVLLWLPVFLQLIVQLAFTWMTIGNPAASLFQVSLTNTMDWSRSHGGNPSVMVSIVANSIFFCIWALLPFGKGFILSLAPAVMAVSLSGGTAGRDSWKYAGLCTFSVLVHDIITDRQHRQYLLDLLWLCLSKLSFSPMPLQHPSSFVSPSPEPIWHWWNYVLVACQIHIVTHGCIRLVRRWIDGQSSRKASTRFDHDPGPSLTPSTITTPPDISVELQYSGSTDGRTPGPSLSATQKTSSSGKRRKKQANLVRGQQPLWAAIANTRITNPGESTLNQTKQDRCEVGATRGDSLGDAFRCSDPDTAWVTDVKATEVSFEANLFMDGGDDANSVANREVITSDSIDVRINNMRWPSYTITKIERLSGDNHWRIQGKILDLTPSFNYCLEFIRTCDQTVMCSAHLFTSSVMSVDHAADLLLQPQAAIRPPSPISTMKKTIAREKANLNEARHRQAKAHKAHQQAARILERDVNSLKQRSLETDGSDKGKRERKLQCEKKRSQEEDMARQLERRLRELENVPQAESTAYEESRKRHDDYSAQLAELNLAIEVAKKAAAKAESDAQADEAKTRNKLEKQQSRLISLNERHRATSEDIEAKRNSRIQREQILTSHISQQNAHVQRLRQSLTASFAMRQDLESAIANLQRGLPNEYGYAATYGKYAPQTPEIAQANVNHRATHGVGLQNSIGNPPFHSRQSSVRNRGRTSSMLSAVSGFTDVSIDDNPTHVVEEKYASSRNGSGSSGSHSYLDPTSPPVPPRLSPIGTEVGRGSPRQKR